MTRSTPREIPVADIRGCLAVDPTSRTGLRWTRTLNPRAVAGSEAGTVNSGGYFHVQLNGRRYMNSRLVWTLATGADPGEFYIDHISRDIRDNRIENLRLVTHRQNHHNRGDHGDWPVGVSYSKQKRKFRADIRVFDKKQFLGYFQTPGLASAAYQKAYAELQNSGSAVNAA